MTVAASPREELIYWSFVSKDSVTGSPDMMLIYHYGLGEWTTADATTDFIFPAMSLAWSIDELDQFGSIDQIPASPDDPLWSGGQRQLWSMDANGAVYSFSGPTLELTLETPEFQLSRMGDGKADIAIVSAARPLFEGDATAHIRVGIRKLQNSAVEWGDTKQTNAENGFAYFREKGRYQRLRLRLSGEWKRAYGLQIDAKAAGRR